jgi:hypothetical protein
MKAKLIKENNFYKLIQDNTILVKISINESIDIHYSFGKLSLSNCKAIELGYDLDELAKEELLKAEKHHKLLSPITYRDGVIKGFRKALEILGDKESKLVEFIKDKIDSFEYSVNQNSYIGEGIDGYVQQTEWDVEIVMEDSIALDGHTIIDIEPKLDADGCIILKRKS